MNYVDAVYLKTSHMRSTEKKYYKISEVAEMLGIPASTLRYWERSFTVIQPRRHNNIRYYTKEDIEKIRMVWYLVKERGMRLEVAEQEIRHNRRNVSRRHPAIERLYDVRDRLQELSNALEALWRREGSV